MESAGELEEIDDADTETNIDARTIDPRTINPRTIDPGTETRS
jgi:hypothetical protein